MGSPTPGTCHLPKAPLSDTITLGLRFQQTPLGEHSCSIYRQVKLGGPEAPPGPTKLGARLQGSNYYTVALSSHASKGMLKILQAKLQQYVNHELPDVRAGFRKG